jgi:hypothetical protein
LGAWRGSKIIFGKSESQASKGEEGKLVWKRETIFTWIFWTIRGWLSARKSTDDGMLERKFCLVVFYAGNVNCVPIK